MSTTRPTAYLYYQEDPQTGRRGYVCQQFTRGRLTFAVKLFADGQLVENGDTDSAGLAESLVDAFVSGSQS